jgi:glycogen(starch) synthase
MRVLFWCETFRPYLGGVEVLAAKLLPALAERGYEFVVVTRKDSDEVPDESRLDGISVYRFPFWTALASRDVEQVMQIRQQVAGLKEAFGPELVHVNFVGPSIVIHHQTATAHRSPMLVTLHTLHADEFVRTGTVLESALNAADWVTACSWAVLREARRQQPGITARSSVVWNGLDPPIVSPEPLPFDHPRLLCLGRMVPEKGFDLALAAFASLIDRYPRLRLVIAGDGTIRTDLERQAAQLGIHERVDFAGWVQPGDVPALINGSTLVVMPSRWEGLPLTALEAAQMGRPIVATRVGGMPEVVVNGETGLLVDKDDSQALAQAIAMLLDRPQTAQRMGAAARHRALDAFSFERHVEAYDAVYRRLINVG